MALTAKEAAEQVGLSKAAILKAIKTGKISAQKDYNGEWRIEPSELFRRYTPVTREGTQPVDIPSAPVRADSSTETALLREMLVAKDDVIADLRRRLDAEADERRRLTALLTVKDEQPRPVGGFWARLFGRTK